MVRVSETRTRQAAMANTMANTADTARSWSMVGRGKLEPRNQLPGTKGTAAAAAAAALSLTLSYKRPATSKL
ncbi:unnamed protein product [Ambrosiozyma monospora]|uniref:Unnamed protein product n=1 Tax=Ambrosiozyma monospora TaxID=43982 RepID=A0ACB5SWR9_AMBMO|nr:unnamed protein product [Ambrosiozyma monospora]